jgi:hypothetical protein
MCRPRGGHAGPPLRAALKPLVRRHGARVGRHTYTQGMDALSDELIAQYRLAPGSVDRDHSSRNCSAAIRLAWWPGAID